MYEAVISKDAVSTSFPPSTLLPVLGFRSLRREVSFTWQLNFRPDNLSSSYQSALKEPTPIARSDTENFVSITFASRQSVTKFCWKDHRGLHEATVACRLLTLRETHSVTL